MTQNPNDAAYWLCRRSLRLWPITGADLKKSLGTFLRSKLLLDADFLRDMGEVSVKRVPAGPRAKIRGEVIAVFSTSPIRDLSLIHI